MTRNWFVAALMIAASTPLAVLAQVSPQDQDPRNMNQHSATIGHQSGPQAPTGPRTGDRVSFCGKVVALVETGCIGIVGTVQTVEVTALSPKPVAGKVITGIGTVSTQPNVCMQGLHLSAATWKEVASCE